MTALLLAKAWEGRRASTERDHALDANPTGLQSSATPDHVLVLDDANPPTPRQPRCRLTVDEFDGKVDLVIGEEAYGGMIAFCLAARHPDLFDHVAVWLAGHRLSEEGKELELGFGRLMAEGRTGDAGALLVRALMPGLRVPGVDRIFGAVLVRMAFGTLHQYFRNDVLVEAEAVAAFDGRQILPKIQVPVLLIGCDQDLEITREIFEETAELIPDCTLLIYEGMNGFQAVNDKRLPMDVLHWAEPSIGGATP